MSTHLPAYLAFDLGASSGRAILGTLEGERLHMEELHRFTTPLREEGERLYWDLEALWGEMQTGLERALTAAPGLRSVSTDSWGVDYLSLRADGTPVRASYCYRDPRVRGAMAQAHERVSADEIYAVTGIQFMEINTLYQVLVDLEQEPERVDETKLRLLIADYFNHRLGGRAAAEVSLASTTQLLDAQRRTWAEDLMRRFGMLPERWPEVVASGTRLGTVSNHPQIAVVAGCSHDTACAVAAVPAEEHGPPWAYISCGTWSLLGAELPEPLLGAEAREAGFTNEAGLDGTVRFLKNLTGLWVLQECERAWREAGDAFTYDELLAEAEAAPGTGAFVDLNDPRFSLRGDMEERLHAYCREHGLPVPESRGALVRTILESMAESHRRTLRLLEEVIGQSVEVLHIVGGGARNEMLCRLTAEACGCRVVAGPAEATALGNLLVQARTMGDLPRGTSLRAVVRASSELKMYEPEST